MSEPPLAFAILRQPGDGTEGYELKGAFSLDTISLDADRIIAKLNPPKWFTLRGVVFDPVTDRMTIAFGLRRDFGNNGDYVVQMARIDVS